MSRPIWEETWEFSDPYADFFKIDMCGHTSGIVEYDVEPKTDPTERHRAARARAVLASCAPEMTRMLIAGESADNSDGEYTPKCPWCHGRNSMEFGDFASGHHGSACPWVSLMRKAGII